jgi:sn-glycerol 3-phosphate transport system substrate-binding protein
MPRFPRLVGGAVAVALLAAGCGSSGNDAGGPTGPATEAIELPDCPVDALANAAGPVEVTVWYQLDAKTGQTFESQVTAYNASQSKVRVKAERQGASYEELLRKYEQAIPSRNLPDVMIAEDTATQFLIDSQTVLPAQACFDAEGLSTDGFNQAAVNHYTYGEALWPASASLSNILTYYNKNHFRRAELDPEKAPATLAEVRQMAEKIKAAGVVDKPVVLKADAWFVETQLTGAGQTLVNNENGYGSGQTTEATFDTDTTRDLFAWVKGMVDDGLMTTVQAVPGTFDHYLAMANQNSSITIETSTAATSVVAFLGGDTSVAAELGRGAQGADVTNLDIGVGPVFGVEEAGQAQIGGNGFYLMNTSTPEETSGAWDFMKWWNQVDQQVTWNLEGSYLPFVDAAVQDPRLQAFWSEQLAGKWLSIAYGQLQGGDPNFTGALIGPYDKFRLAIRDALASVTLQGADPATAIQTAVEQTNEALATYNASM